MPGLVAFYDTSGQETERVYSYKQPRSLHGASKTRMMMSPSVSDPEKVWRYLHSFRYNTSSVTSACLSVYPSIRLSICLSVGLSVCFSEDQEDWQPELVMGWVQGRHRVWRGRTMSHSLICHLLTTVTLHHTLTISFQAQNSPFPQIFHHSLLTPTWTDFSDYNWTGLVKLSLHNGFSF